MDKSVDEREIIQSVLDLAPATQAIYLFGSYGRGEERKGSDLDIALLLADQIESQLKWKWQTHLMAKFGREVDLIDLMSVSTVFQFQIITSGRRIFIGDFDQSEKFEDRVFQLYLTLNDDRRYILEDISATGKIYG